MPRRSEATRDSTLSEPQSWLALSRAATRCCARSSCRRSFDAQRYTTVSRGASIAGVLIREPPSANLSRFVLLSSRPIAVCPTKVSEVESARAPRATRERESERASQRLNRVGGSVVRASATDLTDGAPLVRARASAADQHARSMSIAAIAISGSYFERDASGGALGDLPTGHGSSPHTSDGYVRGSPRTRARARGLITATPSRPQSAAFFRDARCNGMFGEEAAAAAGCDGASRIGDGAFGPISAFDDASLSTIGGELELWEARRFAALHRSTGGFIVGSHAVAGDHGSGRPHFRARRGAAPSHDRACARS